MSLPKRKAAAVSTAVAAAAVVFGGAPAAYAKVVDVKYDCKTPIGDKSAVSPIDITAAKSGSGYRIVMSFRKGVSSSPVDLGKGAMNPSALITLGGAGSGSLKVSGPANAETVPANTPIKINDLTGTYVPRKSGKVTFTAGVLTIKALGTTTTCTPGNSPGPSLTLDVAAAAGSGGGSSSGGSSSGGSGASGGGESLPQTGPEDGAVALGTLGGTVLLLGAGGILWLTRRPGRRI
ncbi:LPXTG cell wall anchor domain-containing protein [Streptomyces sp. NPDC026673]|uniref:LPXTG cell wall anchor domain-containing protein n=1 Tax=Streptomyces sp. NPDC026673 TaxID=3155724 RepID=UPI003404D7A7